MKKFLLIQIVIILLSKTLLAGDYWIACNNGIENIKINSIAIDNNDNIFAADSASGVWFSSDRGHSWLLRDNGLDTSVVKLAVNKRGNIYAGTLSGAVFFTYNSGQSWSQIKDESQENNPVNDILIDNNDFIYIAVNNERIYHSTNNGQAWSAIPSLPGSPSVICLAGSGNVIYAGTSGSGLFKTTNGGGNWQVLDCQSSNISALFISEMNFVFAGNPNGKIYQSYDEGATWNERASLYYPINEITETAEGILYASVNNKGPYLSPDFGMLWGPFTNGIGKVDVFSIASNSLDTLYSATRNGIHKTFNDTKPLSEPKLILPKNKSTGLFTSVSFKWYRIRGTDNYEMIIAYDENFEDVFAYFDDITDRNIIINNLDYNKIYYWKVRAVDDGITGPWSETRWCRTTLAPPNLLFPKSFERNLPIDINFTWELLENATSYDLQVALDTSFSEQNIVVNEVLDTTYYSISLDYDKKYYWRVKAINEGSESSWSVVWNFTTEMEAPELIMPADSVKGLETWVEFVWEEIEDVTSYTFVIADNLDLTNIILYVPNLDFNKFKYDLPEYNKEYFWSVKYEFGMKESGWSTRSFTTGLEPPDLLTPKDNSINEDISLQLRWHHRNGFDRYYVAVSKDEDFEDVVLWDSTVLASAFELNDLEYKRKYYWKVKGKVEDEWSLWSGTRNFVTMMRPPDVIFPVDEDEELELPIRFCWEVYDSISRYGIEISEDTSFNDPVLSEPDIKDTFLTVSSLGTGREFFWRLKVYNEDTMSVWTDIFSFRTKVGVLERPELLEPLNNSKNIITPVKFVWDNVIDAQSYHFQLGTDPSLEEIQIQDSSITCNYYQIDKLENNTNYFWHVRAKNQSILSPWSHTWNLTTSSESNSVQFQNKDFIYINIAPIPVQNYANIKIILNKNSLVTLRLINIFGTQVNSIIDNKLMENGFYQFKIDFSKIPQGIYLFDFRVNDTIKSLKFIVLK
jgi:photosystem II stability/assembly factor-like uncharacterized protein